MVKITCGSCRKSGFSSQHLQENPLTSVLGVLTHSGLHEHLHTPGTHKLKQAHTHIPKHVYECFASMHVRASCTCLVPAEGIRSPGLELQTFVCWESNPDLLHLNH